MGFAAISPVVGLYAVVLVGTSWRAPPGSGSCRSRSPGSACCSRCTRSSRRSSRSPAAPTSGAAGCIGGAYGWFSGWVAICAYAVANTTIAYLGAPWALTLLGIEPTPHAIVATGMVLVLVCALVGALGIDVLGRAIRVGIAAEASRRSGSGSRCCSSSASRTSRSSRETLGAEALSGGSVAAALLAALAVGGWVFIGFDACVGPRRRRATPRATCRGRSGSRCSSVGALVILNAVAVTLAHRTPRRVVAGEDVDPVTTAVVSSFGSWSAKPFAAVVLVAFLACGMAAQSLTARAIYSIARDGVLPGSGFLRRVDRRRSPIGGDRRDDGDRAASGLLLGPRTRPRSAA